MNNYRSAISAGQPYDEVGEYWEMYGLEGSWSRPAPAKNSGESHPEAIYYPVESDLSHKLHEAAQQRGVTAQMLLNLWLQEKMAEG